MAAYPTTAPVVPKVEQSDLDSLKTDQAETQKVELSQQAPSTAATSSGGVTSGDATTQATSEGADASFQANKIMSESSPLMNLARNDGMLLAAQRGLSNSSISAGAAQAAATKAAVPLAQQNAATVARQDLANQDATNQMESLNVTEANKANLMDTDAQNKMQQQYDDTTAKADMMDADAVNKAAMQAHSTDAEVNRTWLAGEVSQTLANIQGQYQEIISVNQSAASMYGNTMDSLAEMWASSAPLSQKTAFTTSSITFLENSLKVTASISSMNFNSSGLTQGATPTTEEVKSGTVTGSTSTSSGSTNTNTTNQDPWDNWSLQSGL